MLANPLPVVVHLLERRIGPLVPGCTNPRLKSNDRRAANVAVRHLICGLLVHELGIPVPELSLSLRLRRSTLYYAASSCAERRSIDRRFRMTYEAVKLDLHRVVRQEPPEHEHAHPA